MEPSRRVLRAWFPKDKETWMADRSAAELERFLAERADHLLRTAVLLTGSREAGEDLLQTAVERLLRRWRRFDGDPEGYLRRTLCNLATDSHRRAGRWRQKESLLRTALRQAHDATGEVDLRDALVRLLLQLPARQRAVLVLRYWEQLTDAETAEVLGCPEGTVKSAGSRGLARLRELADNWDYAAAVCGRNGT
jgi:RNA polymerase sigma-70 factor (sigma-E family)